MIFQKVVFRIQTGTIIGEVRRGSRVVDEIRWTESGRQTSEFNVAITDELRNLGYDMRDLADTLFDPADLVKVRYELAAILHEATLDFEYDARNRYSKPLEGFGTADVRVEVKLHDAVENKTVYSRTFQGHGEDEGMKPNPIVAAVADAVLQSTSDPDFLRLVSKGGAAASSDAGGVGERIGINKCATPLDRTLPGDLAAILESVVEIQAGQIGGAGVIISPDGWILTAAHVVSGASEL